MYGITCVRFSIVKWFINRIPIHRSWKFPVIKPIVIKHAIFILEKRILQIPGEILTIVIDLTQQCMSTGASANKYSVLA